MGNGNTKEGIILRLDELDVEELRLNIKLKELQKKLRVSADGIFGNNTKNAVKKFQKSNRLTADGVVGKNTAHKLGWLYKGK